MQKFGRLDGMVINHGILDSKLLKDATLESIKYTYDVNVFSCIAMVRYGLKSSLRMTG